MIKKIKYLFLKVFGNKNIKSRPKNVETIANKKSFYDFKLKSIDGNEIDFSVFKGKKVLIVNTASECGFTPQYFELNELYQKYGDKIIVLGFPSNNFGSQESGSNKDIEDFCKINYEITFPLFEKSDVIGNNQNIVYKWLTNKNENGWNEEKPTWNFNKYLINEKGELIKFYSSSINPMGEEIVNQL